MEVTHAAQILCAYLGEGDQPEPSDLLFLAEHQHFTELDAHYRTATSNVASKEAFGQVTTAWKVLTCPNP